MSDNDVGAPEDTNPWACVGGLYSPAVDRDRSAEEGHTECGADGEGDYPYLIRTVVVRYQ